GGLDALGAEPHSPSDRLLHRAAEGDSSLELGSDALGDQLGGEVGLLNFHDVDVDLAADHLFQLCPQLVDLSAALADNHAGLSAVDVDSNHFRIAFDLDAGDTGVFEALLEELTDLVVFYQGIAEGVAFRVPAGIPIFNNANTKTVRVYFLAHSLPPHSCSFKTRVMCEDRFSTLNARPWSRGLIRFMVGP